MFTKAVDLRQVLLIKLLMSKNKHLQLEIIWWLFTLVLATLVLLPIKSQGINFPFYAYNMVYVIATVTLTRYLFFLNLSWLKDRFVAQAGLIFMLIPLLFMMGQGLNEFITYQDNNGPDVLIKGLTSESANAMNAYIKSEYFFFGTWAMVAGLILPFRILVNVWRRYLVSKRQAA